MTTAPEKKTAAESADGKVTPIEYLKMTMETPKGGRIIVKQISKNYFRVNIMEQIKKDENLVADWRITTSKMIEVVRNSLGYELVDRTVRR